MSELDDRLIEGRATVATMDPPEDLWARVVERSNTGDAAILDLTTARPRRRPSLWLAVAAVTVLLALVGALALLDDDPTVDTAPATTEATESPTTEAPQMAVFGPPSFNLDLLPGWTIAYGDDLGGPRDLDLGPVSGLPQMSIKFAIPDAATAEDAVADIAAQAPSPYVISDPVDTTVGSMPATCMDVETPEGESGGAPLFQIRDPRSEIAFDVVLEEGAVGWLCVVDVQAHPVIVLVQAPTAEFAAFLEEAQAVLDSVEFE